MSERKMLRLTCRHPAGQYDIRIGRGALLHVGAFFGGTGSPRDSRVAVVADSVVWPLYGPQTCESLQASGFVPVPCPIPSGESHKTLATVETLYGQFLAGGIDRSDTVLALGGGVTGDIAGLAAATFLRGVRFVQTPTTLLAMVDASVGGKVGVDLPEGKNLVGAFKQPAVVLIDPSVLATLAPAELRSGVAEVLKHGVIADPHLFSEVAMHAGDPAAWWNGTDCESWIARSLSVKIAVVEQDPFEHGRRAVLNLGHTLGHALEKLSRYSLPHGNGVGIGMVAAARIAHALGIADPGVPRHLESALAAWELPTRCPPFEVGEIERAMVHDKKSRAGQLRWVLPTAIGTVQTGQEVAPDVVRSVLLGLGARSDT